MDILIQKTIKKLYSEEAKMKRVANAQEGRCFSCWAPETAQLIDGHVICSECGSTQFVDHKGEIFKPIFEEKDTYQVSPYTPSLPCR